MTVTNAVFYNSKTLLQRQKIYSLGPQEGRRQLYQPKRTDFDGENFFRTNEVS